MEQRASLLGARTLGAPGIATRSKKLLVARCLTRSKKLRRAKGISTRTRDATRGSWPYYCEQEAASSKKLVGAKGIATRSKDAIRGPGLTTSWSKRASLLGSRTLLGAARSY